MVLSELTVAQVKGVRTSSCLCLNVVTDATADDVMMCSLWSVGPSRPASAPTLASIN